jgi:SAM-dependent methyltransferase
MSAGPSRADLDPTTPNVARMYDFFLGGKDNFTVDREAAARVLAGFPEVEVLARENRRFLGRAVRFAAEQGVEQFIDIGSGLPAANSVHQVAAEVVAEPKVVYADLDPVVVAHARALLAGGTPSVAAVQGDMRQIDAILEHPETKALIDFGKPVAVLLLAVLHFLPDSDDPEGLVASIRDRMAPGSFLIVSYLASGDRADWNEKLAVSSRVYATASQNYVPRGRDGVVRFFDGFELVEPGLVPVSAWRDTPADEAVRRATEFGFAGVGRFAQRAA